MLFRFSSWLELFSKKVVGKDNPGWVVDIRIGLIAFCISALFAAPPLWIYFAPGSTDRLVDFMSQSADPFRRDLNELILGYRILVPLFNHIIGLREFWSVLPAIFSSFLNCCLCARILRIRTENYTYSVFGVIGISLTYFIVNGITFWAAPDSVAHLFSLIIAAFSLSSSYFILALPMAMLVDERALISFLFLFIFKWNHNHESINKKLSHFNLFFSFTAGLIVWQLVRLLIDSGLISPKPENNVVSSAVQKFLETFQPNIGWGTWALNIICTFKWMYLFPIFLLFFIFYKFLSKEKLAKEIDYQLLRVFIINFFLFVLVVIASIFNGDQWRTMSFAFFFIIESIILTSRISTIMFSRLGKISMLLMLSTPVIQFGSNYSPQISFPLPLVLIRTFLTDINKLIIN